MHVEIYGTGPRDIVLLHGIPGSGAVWNKVARILAADHRVIVPDLLGFGFSPRPQTIDDLWADAQAVALEQELERLGVRRAVFAAHDFGGPVALALSEHPAGRDRIAGLCLAATNAFPDTPIPLPIRAVTWPLVGRVAESVLFSAPSLRMMLRSGSSARLEATRYLGDRSQRRAIRTIFGHALHELDARYAATELALQRICVPTLVVWGDEDPFFPPAQGERTADSSGAELMILAGAGHFLPEERPDELAAALVQLSESSLTR